MANRIVGTPYFLDEFSSTLEMIVSRPGWLINRPTLPAGDTQARMGALYRPLADFVADSVQLGDRAVSLAGDCCTAIAVLAGLQHAGMNPNLLWFDAHGDLNTWETTPSGFLGGMPLAMMLGRGEQTICEAVGLQPLPENQTILTDGRDLDPDEVTFLANSDVVHLRDVHDLLDYRLPASPTYVHFDVDVLNPKDASAMRYLATGGPTAAELKQIFQHLAQTADIACISISMWNPALDHGNQTQTVCMDLIHTLLG